MMNTIRPTLLVSLIGLLIAGPATLRAAAVDEPVLDNADVSEHVESADPDEGYYYRWIDAQGRVQFTDFEPIGVPAERIPLEPEEEEEVGTAIVEPALPERTPTPPAAATQAHTSTLPPACAQARRQLDVLYTDLPVYRDEQGEYRVAVRGDAYAGSRQYLDAAARTEAIRRARAAVLRHCDPAAFKR